MASVRKNPRKPDKSSNGALEDISNEDEADNADIGDALRSAYEDAVSEDIPAEMLDLLGKLS